MKTFKFYNQIPDSPLVIHQELCDKVSEGLKNKLGSYYNCVLPKHDMLSDVEFYRLAYLNSALELICLCPGFEEHIKVYKSNPLSNFFVAVISDFLLSHGLRIVLEPISIGTKKNADILAFQDKVGLNIFFECKQVNENPERFFNEQKEIFHQIKDLLSSKYSCALFYRGSITKNQVHNIRNQIEKNLNNGALYESKILAEVKDIGFKLTISGIGQNIHSDSEIEVKGIPNFSDYKQYSNANGINLFGKNIVFYKEGNMNSIDNVLKTSKDKVINKEPYVVCIDLSGPRLNWIKVEEHILNHFDRGDYTSISGVLLVEHGVTEDGLYGITTKYIHNKNSVTPLEFLNNYFYSPIKLNILERNE